VLFAIFIALLISGNIIFLSLFLIKGHQWKSAEKTYRGSIKVAKTMIDKRNEKINQIEKERDSKYKWYEELVNNAAEERDEMKTTLTDKIFKKLGPLIRETTIESLSELGANRRAEKLAGTVLEKLRREL